MQALENSFADSFPLQASSKISASNSTKVSMLTALEFKSVFIVGNGELAPSKALKSLEECFRGTENNAAA